ncbi:MAG: hypothetical protein B7X06_01790, partial [Verrucomicrobia bacterium 21-51-4]
AGIGSRYGGLKQIEGFGPSGETLLEYALHDARRAGFNQAVMVIRPELETEFKTQILRRLPEDFRVSYVYQDLTTFAPVGFKPSPIRTKPWGTAHAVLSAKPSISGPFAVINADDFYGPGAFRKMAQALRAHGENPQWAALVAYKLRNTLSDFGSVSRGVCEINEANELIRVIEHCNITRTAQGIQSKSADGALEVLQSDVPVSLNFWGFSGSFMQYLQKEFPMFLEMDGQDPKSEWFLPSVVDQWIDQDLGKVEVLRTDESWCGVTYREETAQVRSRLRDLIEHGVYPENLWELAVE